MLTLLLLQERFYFDSGDYELSKCGERSRNGQVETGTAHPLRKDISHPSAPAPGESNVESSADQSHQISQTASTVTIESPLVEQMEMNQGDKKKGGEARPNRDSLPYDGFIQG